MAVTTESWQGKVFPSQIAADLALAIVSGAPFAKSLNLQQLKGRAMVYPKVSPTGADWTPEYSPLPGITLGDDAVEVATAKIGGLVDLSNESIKDSAIALYDSLKRVLGVAFGPTLDQGLLYGTGVGGQPVGVVAALPEVTAETLRTGAIQAASEVAAYGGTPTWLIAHPSTLAAEYAAVDGQGNPLYPGWGAPIANIPTVPCPSLAAGDILVTDSASFYLLQSEALAVEGSEHFHWNLDALTMRVKGRFAAAAPVPERAGRKITVTPPPVEP